MVELLGSMLTAVRQSMMSRGSRSCWGTSWHRGLRTWRGQVGLVGWAGKEGRVVRKMMRVRMVVGWRNIGACGSLGRWRWVFGAVPLAVAEMGNLDSRPFFVCDEVFVAVWGWRPRQVRA